MAHDHAPNNDADVPMDDPEPGSTWFFSIVGTVVFIAFVLVTCVVYFNAQQRVTATEVTNVPVKELEDLRLAQKSKLADYGWYEVEAGDGSTTKKLRIQIDQAMRLVAAELSGGTAAPAPRVSSDASSNAPRNGGGGASQ